MSSYFLPTNEEEKAGRIIQSAAEIVWETQPSEFAALLREQSLIRTFRPRFNVQGMPDRQRPVFLCLGRSPETFYVAREADERAVAWEGPLFGSNRVHRAVEILNRHFQLRDCSNQTPFHFSDQRTLFDIELRPACVRFEMGTCTAPCARACTRSQYQRQVERAVAFLKGATSNVVEHLESQMRLAAGRLHFEQAIRYREDTVVMRWLCNRLADHASARDRLTCIYPVRGQGGLDIWYLIRGGVVEHAISWPRTTRGTRTATKEVEKWFAQAQTIGSPYQRREETLAIVSSWFRKYSNEMGKLILIDNLSALSMPTAIVA